MVTMVDTMDRDDRHFFASVFSHYNHTMNQKLEQMYVSVIMDNMLHAGNFIFL